MKPILHAERSAQIFGGSPDAYLPFHEMIDWQKMTVTADAKGKFFLHHIDIGLPILEAVFGRNIDIGSERRIPVKKLLLQHLFEDFGCIPTFKNDWLKATFAVDEYSKLLLVDKYEKELKGEIKKAYPKIKDKEALADLDKIFNILNLRAFTKDKEITTHPMRQMIFDHQLGFSLAVKVLGKHKIGPYPVQDILESRAGFSLMGETHDFNHYFKHVHEKHWMLAPPKNKRLNVDQVMKLILMYEAGKDCSVTALRKEPKPKKPPFKETDNREERFRHSYGDRGMLHRKID